MSFTLSKKEGLVLKFLLEKKLKYFRTRPHEWEFWKELEDLEDLSSIATKLDIFLQEEE
jgi:hypothetical protein